ncbi:hypothetical protein POL68_39950 [Stigmatella sp. ncwal1]|uniref:LVIVD repeat-containing protein n=1 Tax=Stigmatella ashevillensis TaxID=2995309 RepID=A0ABT5DQP0_9BACT|nr:hypothetical protein [Stigmatella ashevillena]MDC0714691.1 hypothetical protein [Stigmatella ashevillena]
MNRFLALSLGALLPLVGCGKNETPLRQDCELEELDLSACDASSLATVQSEGIWNMDFDFGDGEHSPGVIQFQGSSPHVAGLPMSQKRVEPGLLLLASDVTNANGVPLRYLFAGCRSSRPTQLSGVFRRCSYGTADLNGTFQAVRVARRTGEDEASKVELVLEVPLPSGSARDVFVAGGHAYVSAYDGGLHIFDVSTPDVPREPGRTRLVASLKPSSGDVWNEVWVQGQTLYVASSTKGVLIYDVTKPSEPLYKRTVPGSAVDARALSLEGNWLYVASPYPNAEVLIFDVTKPQEPALTKRYFVEDAQPALGARPYGVQARNGRLYVSNWSYGLAVTDVTDPSKPKRMGSFSYTGATSRTAAVGTFGSRTLAFEAGQAWDSHLRVLDVTSPENITQAGEFKLRPEVSVQALALSGERLYVAHYQDGLRVLQVSPSGALEQVGYYNTWREADSGRGASFYEGLSGIKVPGDGFIYASETSRGLLVFREQP